VKFDVSVFEKSLLKWKRDQDAKRKRKRYHAKKESNKQLKEIFERHDLECIEVFGMPMWLM